MEFSFGYNCLAFILLFECLGQQIGNTVYITRWHSIDTCDQTTPVKVNGSSVLYQTFEVWNGVLNVTKEMVADNAMIVIQKCGEGFFLCEEFLTFKVPRAKNFFLAKDKGWASLWEAMHPQPKLPRIQKGIYNVTNATLDVSLMATFIPELMDHSWKINSTIYNRNNIEQGCIELQFYIVKYIQRFRKRKRKNYFT